MKIHSNASALIWLCLVLSITLVIAYLLPVTPQDYWWYLRIGRDTLTAGAIPQIDTLSYSQSGAPVVYFSWGASVLFWVIYKLGGLTLTVLVRGLLIALAYFLAWLTARWLGAGRISASLVFLISVLVSSNNWAVRPQIFTYPLFALGIYLLYRWQKGDKKSVWGLPLISLLWVNLHGSFIMLVLLNISALVFGQGDKRHLGLATLGVILTTFLNPRGFASWTYVYHSLTVASNQLFSKEWQPPVNFGWQMNIFFIWLLVFPLLVAFSPRKLNRLEWTWFLGFGFLALSGERYIIWFVFILMVLTSLLLADWEKKYLRDPKNAFPALNIALGLLLLLLPLPLLPGIRSTWWSAAPPVTETTPIAATQWLAAHPNLSGPLWSEIGFSSYLEYALPERPVWIDTRFEVFPVQQWQQYREISNASWAWQGLLLETDANLLMISISEQPALVQALNYQDSWCQIYRDDVTIIYQRKSSSLNGNCGDG
jgi:hypothetical protein